MKTEVVFNQCIKNKSGEEVKSFIIPDMPCRIIKGDYFEWESFLPENLENELVNDYSCDETKVDFVVIEKVEGEATQIIYLSEG